MSRTRIAIAAAFLVPMLILAAFAGKVALFAFTAPKPGASQPIIIEIGKGQGPNDVARTLLSKGVITDSREFLLLGKVTRQWKRMKAGEYEVSASMTPIEVMAVVTSGVSLQHAITVREGENMYEIADDLADKKVATKEAILALCRSEHFIGSLGLGTPTPPTLEGYLYPETYFVNRSMSAEDILRQMVKKFVAVWSPAWTEKAKSLGMTRHEVVILASMVEKETGAKQERPLISSVFHNRLHKRMRLQSDPTTIYGIWERYDGNIHKSDLLESTPYNTYTVPALPRGPISNPGREALQAALEPATSEYLFFVSKNDGTHEFTRAFGEHQAAVRKFQLDPKAREGKSWRDLKRSAAGSSP